MPKKPIQPGDKVPLTLTATERKIVLDLPCLEDDYDSIIQNTPAGEPVMMSLDDLEDFGDYIAAESNHAEDAKLQKELDRIIDRIEQVLDAHR